MLPQMYIKIPSFSYKQLRSQLEKKEQEMLDRIMTWYEHDFDRTSSDYEIHRMRLGHIIEIRNAVLSHHPDLEDIFNRCILKCLDWGSRWPDETGSGEDSTIKILKTNKEYKDLVMSIYDKNGESILHAAARSLNTSLIDYVINEMKLNIDTLDNYGNSVLHIALCEGPRYSHFYECSDDKQTISAVCATISNLILKSNNLINLPNKKSGDTPFLIFCHMIKEHYQAINSEKFDEYGHEIWGFGTKSYVLDTFTKLIQSGADVTAGNIDGGPSPLQLIEQLPSGALQDILLDIIHHPPERGLGISWRLFRSDLFKEIDTLKKEIGDKRSEALDKNNKLLEARKELQRTKNKLHLASQPKQFSEHQSLQDSVQLPPITEIKATSPNNNELLQELEYLKMELENTRKELQENKAELKDTQSRLKLALDTIQSKDFKMLPSHEQKLRYGQEHVDERILKFAILDLEKELRNRRKEVRELDKKLRETREEIQSTNDLVQKVLQEKRLVEPKKEPIPNQAPGLFSNASPSADLSPTNEANLQTDKHSSRYKRRPRGTS